MNVFLQSDRLLVWDIRFDSIKDLTVLKHQDRDESSDCRIARAGKSSLLVRGCRMSYPTGDRWILLWRGRRPWMWNTAIVALYVGGSSCRTLLISGIWSHFQDTRDVKQFYKLGRNYSICEILVYLGRVLGTIKWAMCSAWWPSFVDFKISWC